MDNMRVIALKAFKDNYIWAIVNDTQRSFSCIDPGDATPVLNFAKQHQLNLKNILITHHHDDHAAGIADLLAHYPEANVYGPSDPRLPLIQHTVYDNNLITIDQLRFKVLSIPGHTRTHIAYEEPANAWLFCGDTLFSAGCGRVFDGTIEQLHHSIQQLKQLPDQTKIYCGHEYTAQNLDFAAHVEPQNQHIQSYINELSYHAPACTLPSTIGLEKNINPFMRTHEPSVQQFVHANGEHATESLAIFKRLRTLKNHFI